ncbi:hypothetical protein FACS189487_02060 [Campylobacterota bacterium]|nr:hypothetical protein FACS189487_02060 [Campylobacterota bacterium]
MTKAEVAQQVEAFMDKFFGEELGVAQKELDFIDENGFVKPELDYIKLRRFLITAYNNLCTIDPSIKEGTLSKIQQDCERLYDYLIEFHKKTKLSKLVYIRDFLPSVPQYRALQNDVTITEALKKRSQSIAVSSERELSSLPPPKNAEELAYIKALRARYVDAIDMFAKSKEKLALITKQLKELEDLMTEAFFRSYDEYVQNIQEGICDVIHVKNYYFDKLLWDLAAKSQQIAKFFLQARIEGDYSTKTFIRYYLRNIDINKSSASDWHLYLQEVLKAFE